MAVMKRRKMARMMGGQLCNGVEKRDKSLGL
jgi:hypothetical protein